MSYDVAEYERQAAGIRKKVRRQRGISREEFLSGFTKNERLKPCITLVLFYGNEWDGSRDLHGILDMVDIPEELKAYINNYCIHLIEVRKLENTEVFRNAEELIAVKKYRGKEGKVNMCKGLQEWLEDERNAGKLEGRTEGRAEGENEKTRIIVKNMLLRGMSDEDIWALAECEQEFADGVRAGL